MELDGSDKQRYHDPMVSICMISLAVQNLYLPS